MRHITYSTTKLKIENVSRARLPVGKQGNVLMRMTLHEEVTGHEKCQKSEREILPISWLEWTNFHLITVITDFN